MLMHSKGKNNQIWSLTRLATVGLSLAALNLATTNITFSQPVVAQSSHLLAKASRELPVVKSAALGVNMNVPWSKPVKIEDPFEGNYLGIFDRNYFWSNFVNNNARVVVISLWSRNSIRVLLAYSARNCAYRSYYHALLAAPECLISHNTLKITNLYIKIGEQIFRLEGNNGTFKVSNELATALKNSPAKNVTIRLLSESGETVDSQIGKRTVEAWKAVY
ncbi:hypothetical protein NIES2100_13230 [Calothrix sp. NIES-2100]|uniref:hypothetical protein n=1 Tax=Calothrix sp. NIES-2100 TaxID=1954172 RepID=UPI000B614B18|nr:hypothetical protein NIES2100_13230 [Calothrix sp. NIES-2100]